MDEKEFPKVLVISHNPMSSENNMGKTLASYFSQFPSDCIRQIYLHAGIPSSNVCQNYYSFSDKDALISIFNRFHQGKFFSNQDFSKNNHQYNNSSIYSLGRKKKPIIYLCRDLIWKICSFFNKKIDLWIKEFSPDCIFFASGDYRFSYRIALKISKKYNIPLITCCFDDYYLNCVYKDKPFGKLYYKKFIKIVNKIINYSSSIFVVNPMMKIAYDAKFAINSIVLYTPCSINYEHVNFNNKKGITYIGGLGLNRHEVLIQLGLFFKENYNLYIDVYSFETNKEIIEQLTESNGIIFHGGIHADEVRQIQKNSLLLLHVESFDEKMRNRTRFSLSTKISESLCSGTVLLTFGPSDIASIQYLNNYNYPFVFSDLESLKRNIEDVFNEKTYNDIILASFDIAKKNHSFDSVTQILIKEMGKCNENTSS